MRVIFHADDFGLSTGINRGIIQAHQRGLLTSASLVSAGQAAGEALVLCRENPGLDLGVHLTLSDEAPLLAAPRLKALVRSDGRMVSKYQLLGGILGGCVDFQQVRAEWRAQIERVLDTGIAVSHLDGHQFVHLLPGLFGLCLELAREYDIGYVRTTLADRPAARGGLGRAMQWGLLKMWTALLVQPFRSPPPDSLPAVGFSLAGGRMTRDVLGSLLARLARRTDLEAVEVMFHPGLGDSATRRQYPHWGYDWSNDLALLLDPKLKSILDHLGLATTSFGRLLG